MPINQDAPGRINALYIRVSTGMQAEEGYSIDAQIDMLSKYCESRQLGAYEKYIDAGHTGSNIERPALQQLIEDIKQKKIGRVVVYKLDRLSRSQKDTLYLIEDVFIAHGVDFISINESFDTGTAFGKAMIGILSVFAQLERENIKMRTRMGMKERVKSGLWMGGGHVPYGYDYDRESGILVPNSDADNVRAMYELYLQGYSTYKLAQMFGIKYERIVIQILQRKSNTGVLVYNGEEYPGRHQPLISEETYNKTMKMMKRRSKVNLYSDGKYLLTGLLVCGVCGAKMRYQKWSGGALSIGCYSREASKPHLVKDPNCDNFRYDADVVEKHVLGSLFKASVDIDPDAGAGATTVSAEDELVKQQGIIEAKIKRLYNLYAESEDDILLETIGDAQADLKRVKAHLLIERERAGHKAHKQATAQTLRQFASLWDQASGQDRKRILHDLIESVILTKDNIKIVYRI